MSSREVSRRPIERSSLALGSCVGSDWFCAFDLRARAREEGERAREKDGRKEGWNGSRRAKSSALGVVGLSAGEPSPSLARLKPYPLLIYQINQHGYLCTCEEIEPRGASRAVQRPRTQPATIPRERGTDPGLPTFRNTGDERIEVSEDNQACLESRHNSVT